jgi:hypothetical protein
MNGTKNLQKQRLIPSLGFKGLLNLTPVAKIAPVISEQLYKVDGEATTSLRQIKHIDFGGCLNYKLFNKLLKIKVKVYLSRIRNHNFVGEVEAVSKDILFLFFLLFFVFTNAVKAAEPEQHLVILYNSDTKSYIEGCG